jgi:hypothetical protein
MSLTVCTDTSQWKYHNCSCEKRACVKVTKYDTGIWTNLKYFLKIDWIHLTIQGKFFFIQLWIQIDDWLETNTLKMSCFYAMFCGDAKHVLRIRACSAYIIRTPECGIIRMLFENVNISSYAPSSFGMVSSWRRHMPVYATWQVLISEFSGNSSITDAVQFNHSCEA